MKILVFLFLIDSLAFAVSPLPAESIQLQQLIHKSEKQIEALKEILSQSKKDARNLERANQILAALVKGIDDSIAKHQGTKAYEQALLRNQEKNNYENTIADSQSLRKILRQTQSNGEITGHKKYKHLVDFQIDSVQANKEDLRQQNDLQKALQKAGPAFVPKLETQALIGNWKASTRVSSQLTELLSIIHAMREELRLMRSKENEQAGISLLLSGSEEQNQKQRGAKR